MISVVMFSLSALCFAALFTPSKAARPVARTLSQRTPQAGPLPTWRKKDVRPARVA